MSQTELTSAVLCEELKQFVEGEVLGGVARVDLDENLLADGLVDSLGMLRVVGHIENTYGIRIPPADFTIANFRSIEVICRYLLALTTAENCGQAPC